MCTLDNLSSVWICLSSFPAINWIWCLGPDSPQWRVLFHTFQAGQVLHIEVCLSAATQCGWNKRALLRSIECPVTSSIEQRPVRFRQQPCCMFGTSLRVALYQRSRLSTRTFAAMAKKRTQSAGAGPSNSKKQRTLNDFAKKEIKSDEVDVAPPTSSGADDEPAFIEQVHGKIATAENAARADADPPLAQLQNAIAQHKHDLRTVQNGECVVYWMRMQDMRGKYCTFSRSSRCVSTLISSGRQPSALRGVQRRPGPRRPPDCALHVEPRRLRFP